MQEAAWVVLERCAVDLADHWGSLLADISGLFALALALLAAFFTYNLWAVFSDKFD